MVEKNAFDVRGGLPCVNIVQTLIQYAQPKRVTVIEVTSGNEEDSDKFFTLTPYKKPYEDQIIDGMRVTYRDTGNGPDGLKLVAEVPWVNGLVHGTAIYYYPDGTLMEKVNYANGDKNGFYKRYDENGMKRIQYLYRKGKFIEGSCYNTFC